MVPCGQMKQAAVALARWLLVGMCSPTELHEAPWAFASFMVVAEYASE